MKMPVQITYIKKVCILLFSGLLLPVVYASDTIPVWTYYLSPPFITADGQGLSYEFIELLNQYSGERAHFELNPMPRTRINRNLDDELPGMVLFVNWAWMGDENKRKYLWSMPILKDQNEIISRVSGKTPAKIDFITVDRLKNTVFAGVIGHYYKYLERAFEKGEIKRQDYRDIGQILDLLLRERVDFSTSNSTTLNYAIQQKGLQDKIYISKTPLFSFTRHILLVKALKPYEKFINEFIQSLEDNPKWQLILNKYEVHKASEQAIRR